ncbi:MAG: hypothetical protein EUB_01919 [Eubacterium sp.]|uniref:hypothetical protein n=1 Tax=Eubacterium sp. TaxID=142586 RepID=UPI00304A62CE
MAFSVGNISLDLLFNTKDFQKALGKTDSLAKKAGRQLEGSFNGAGSSLGGLTSAVKGFGIAAVAAFAVDKVVAFSKECINLGSDLTEVQNVVDVTFGSMSKQVNEFAKGAINNYGLSETMAKKYMGTFGAMSKAFNFSTAQAYDMSAALTGLSGDVASFYNISQDEAYTKLKSVFTGETETLKDLGVVMTQNALDAYALANGYGKTTSKMTEQEKVALRLAFVQEKLALASGDYSRTSGQWANQVRTLTLQWQQFKATVGQGLINLFTPVIKVLNWVLAKLQVVAEAFKRFSEFVTGKTGEDTSDGLGGIIGDLADLEDGTGDLGDKVEDTAKKVKKSIMGFDELHLLDDNDNEDLDGFLDKLGSAFDEIGNNSGGGNPIDPQIWQPLIEGSIDFKNKTKQAFEEAGESADEFKTKLKGVLALFPELKKQADELKQKLKDTFKIPGGWKIPKPDPVPALDLTLFLESKRKYQEPINAPSIITVFAPAIDLVTFFIPSVERYQQPIVAPVFQPVIVPALDLITLFTPSLSLALELLFGFNEQSKQSVIDWSGNLGLQLGLFGALIATTFQTAWSSANNSFQTNTGAMTAGALVFIATTVSSFQTGLETITANVTAWGITTQLNFQTTLENAKNWVFNGTENIKNRFVESFAYITGNVLLWKTNVQNGFSTTMSNISSTVSTGVGNARTAFGNFTNSTQESLKSWSVTVASVVGSTFESAVSKIQSAVSRAWDFVSGMISKAKSAISGAFNTNFDPQDILPGMKGKTTVPGIGAMPGSVSPMPGLVPAFASGAYIKPNTPQLAVIGDNTRSGEFVAPEDKLIATVMQALKMFAGQNSSKSSQTAQQLPEKLHLTVQLGDYTFINTIIDMINNETRRQGQQLIITTP